MRRLSVLLFSLALLATAAKADVATILEMPFGAANAKSTAPTKATEVPGATGWYINRTSINDYGAATGGSAGNYAAYMQYTALKTGQCPTITTPPVSGMVGNLVFKYYVSSKNKPNNADSQFSVFLGTGTGYDAGLTGNSAVTRVVQTITVDESRTNEWITCTVPINQIIDSSAPQRIVIGRMSQVSEKDNIYFDDITLYELPSSLLESSPLTTSEGLPYAASGVTGNLNSIHPQIAFSEVGTVSNIAVNLKYRFTGDTDWQDRIMYLDNGVYVPQGGDLEVGVQSGVQLEMYVEATYFNEEGQQTCTLTYTAANPLVLDIVPRGINNHSGYEDLAISGAFPTPMTLATNGVWVGGYERAGGVQSMTYQFTFGDGNGSSTTYGNKDFQPPFEKVVSGGVECPAPDAISRDLVFRFDETSSYLGSVLYADYQSFDDWENTAGTVWAIEKADETSTSGIVDDAGVTGKALLLRAGDSLVLDKTAAIGVGEIGFWFRRAGTDAASVALKRHQSGKAQNDALATYTGIASDRYAFVRHVINKNQSPMETDKVVLVANTDVYLDGVYASDCSTVHFESLVIEPQPIQQNTPITVTATFRVAGGGKLKADSVLLKYGQGNDALCATQEGYFSTTDGGTTWVAELPEGVDRADADFYAYVTGQALDYSGVNIGEVKCDPVCVQVIPYSAVDSVTIEDGTSSTEMRLAADRLWKGAIPAQTAAAGKTYWFLDSDEVKRGAADPIEFLSASGALVEDGELAVTAAINSALAFEYNEAEQTYRVQLAHYDPMRANTAASPAWTRTSASESSNFGGCLKYNASGSFVSPKRDGVGQVMFWAARAGNVAATYKVETSKSDSGNGDWVQVSAANGGTGTISGENLRFFSAMIGDPEVKRVRVTFTGAAVYVQDAVVTASGSYVTMSNPTISVDDGATYADSALVNPEIAYGGRPYITIDLVPMNGANNIEVSVEAVMADYTNGVAIPVADADIVSVPMEAVSTSGDTTTYRVWMPALTAGTTAYRFLAVYDGEDATESVFPKAQNTWYAYTTDDALEEMREPDFSLVKHDNSVTRTLFLPPNDEWRVTGAYLWSAPAAYSSLGFTPTSGQTILKSEKAFHGIGRIYFRGYCIAQYGFHELEVQTSSNGSTWETINTVSIPYGTGTGYNAYSQFCVEVNDYDSKYLRLVRTTDGIDDEDYIYIRDLVVTPPAANMTAYLPSIIHPGYPSKNDDITFSANVANVYSDYPAVNPRVTLHWRRVFGSVNQPWQATKMTSANGADFTATLPAMNPGKLEYYADVAFSGASYRYSYMKRPDGTDMPLYFYYAGDDNYLEEDPRKGNESCTPAYLFSDVVNPVEFTHSTQQRALEAPGEYEGVYLWFKVRAFQSQHDHLQIVYTNALEEVAEGAEPTICTNALQLIGDNLWLTTMSVTNNIHYFATIEGVAPYGGSDTTEYLTESTYWGDDDQETVNPPLASVAGTTEETPIEIDLGTVDPITMMVRLDATTGSYQIRRAAYQDFNDWGADTQFFEDSTGLYDVQNYEQAFDGSDQFPVTVMDNRVQNFDLDDVGEYRDHFTQYGWHLRYGDILRERNPREAKDLVGNVTVKIDQGGYFENQAGPSANGEGLEYVALRARASYGADGHTPYDKTGFGWENYWLAVSNLHVYAISDGNPYVQVMAAYNGDEDYVALRLTQTATISEQNGTVPHVRQDLIKVVNGVETVLATSYTTQFSKKDNSLRDEGHTNVAALQLTENDWIVEIDMIEGNIKAKAFIPNTTWTNTVLTGSAPSRTGTVSVDTFDAHANFRSFYLKEGTSAVRMLDASNWTLGGQQSGDKSKTRWIRGVPSGKTGSAGIERPIPALSYAIGIAKAGADETLPSGVAYETGETFAATSLAYAGVKKTVHYWGNAFVRIEPTLSDADLVIDDVEVQSWHGRTIPEASGSYYWRAREAVVVDHNGSRMLALTTSRADPSKRQMIVTPEMLDGLGTISFNYEVQGGRVTFAIESNNVSGDSDDDSPSYVEIGDRISAVNGEKGEVYRAIRKEISGKIRVRVLLDESDDDATLYIDNLFAKSYPPQDGRSWSAYNALIVAPTRNATVDAKQFEEDVTTQTAFLNNSVDSDTRQNTEYLEHVPYIQTPIINTGIGEIAFWYRAWNAQNPTPGQITFWVAEHGDDPDEMWRQVTVEDLARPTRPADDAPNAEWQSYYEKYATYTNQVAAFQALSDITNGDYQYFSAEICNDTNYVLRICSDTNGTQRVAIDNVIVTEPVRASIDVLSITMYPNTIPLGGEDVGFEVQLGNPRMNPTDIHVYADYLIGTNEWGVANWGEHPDGHIELVQDENDPYLYRSAPGDMVPGQPVDSVVQYRIRVTYTGTFASPVTSAKFDNPEWYEPIDLNKVHVNEGFSPYYFVFSCPTGCVYINEFYPSGGSSYNNREFIEIIGPAGASMGGWYVDLVDGGTLSREEDNVLQTYELPQEAKFKAPEGSTHNWGFYVLGDTDKSIADKVDYVFEDPTSQNLKIPGAIRLRRSMGAYVDLVCYGSGGAIENLKERGYETAGTRGTYGTATRRGFALLAVTDDDTGEEALAFGQTDADTYTVGEMNSVGAAALWGDCPYNFTVEFTNSTAVAISKYFDKYLPADFLCALELNSATELRKIKVDNAELEDGFEWSSPADGELLVTLKKEKLTALNLSTNDVHIITFDVDEGIDPTVELVVIDSTGSESDKSTDVSIVVKDIKVEDGKVTITVSITNNEPDKTVEGWSWGVKGAADLADLPTADLVDELEPLTDEAIEDDLVKEIEIDDADAAGFYKGVLDDGE